MSERTDARDELRRELRVFLHDSDADDVLEAIDRAGWAPPFDVEAALALHDPEAIELAVIASVLAAVAARLGSERVADLAGDARDEPAREEAAA